MERRLDTQKNSLTIDLLTYEDLDVIKETTRRIQSRGGNMSLLA